MAKLAEQIRIAPAELNTVQDVDPFIAPVLMAMDFSATTGVRPAGMVGLLAVLEGQGRPGDGRPIALIPPQSREVMACWQASGLWDALREFCRWPETAAAPVLPQSRPLKPIVRCCHFRDASEVERMLAEMEHSFSTALSGYASLLDNVGETFTELITNVIYHADSNGGFALAQYCEYAAGPAIELAVADAGIGIRNSLAKAPAFADIDSDCAAIRLAMAEGVTSAGDKYRGFGLGYVAANTQLEPSRTLAIRSGKGIITLSGNGAIQEETSPTAYPGTLVGVTIPL